MVLDRYKKFLDKSNIISITLVETFLDLLYKIEMIQFYNSYFELALFTIKTVISD